VDVAKRKSSKAVSSSSGGSQQISERDLAILLVVTVVVVAAVVGALIIRRNRMAEAAAVAAAAQAQEQDALQSGMTGDTTLTGFDDDYVEEEYVEIIENGLQEQAVETRISGVRVDDARPVGGIRNLIISYQSSEKSESGQNAERVQIINVVAQLINEYGLDVDSVSVVTDTAGNFTATVDDVIALETGEITTEEFTERLEETDVSIMDAPTYVTVSTYALNVRSGPSTSASVVGYMVLNEKIVPEGRTYNLDWYQVTYNGRKAWISASRDYVNLTGNAMSLPITR
jgi:hypothetical protein